MQVHCPTAKSRKTSYQSGIILILAYLDLKGTVSRDFLLLVVFMNQFPPSPRVSHYDCFKFFRKFAEIFASQGAPPVSTPPMANLPRVSATPAANFVTSFTSVIDTGGK